MHPLLAPCTQLPKSAWGARLGWQEDHTTYLFPESRGGAAWGGDKGHCRRSAVGTVNSNR